jgi:hypothetical protein
MPQSGHVSFVSWSRDFSFMNVLLSLFYIIRHVKGLNYKLRGFSPQAHYTDQATVAAARVRARFCQVGFVVDKVALGQVFSEYFGFPCQNHSSANFIIIIIIIILIYKRK